MWLQLELKDTCKTFIANVYRPRDGKLQNFTELLELQTLDLYTQGNTDIVIMGDMNIDLLKRNTDTTKYKDCLHTLPLQQLVKDPTRLTDRTRTLIDHINVNHTEMYYTAGSSELGISDHSLVYTVRKKYKEDNETFYVWTRSNREYDKKRFRTEVERTCWDFVTSLGNVDKALEAFTCKLNQIIDKFAPNKWINAKDRE